ncbi:MAG: DUF3108 domain-containing protein [Sulfurospirillaceae bacterium]|nr:DUF3108 domain-containing protein [Sulfurospirillaceae bacterium]
MRFLWFLLLCSHLVFAKDIMTTYKVSFGIFGQIGIAKISLHTGEGKYKIVVDAKSTGFVAFISGNREDIYTSEGYIKDKTLVPLKYTKTVINEVNIGDPFSGDNRIAIKHYTLIFSFDHKAKKVTIKKIRELDGKKTEEKENSKFYTDNDILSLFFNFKNLFTGDKIEKHLILHAIGVNDKNGKINIYPLEEKNLKVLTKENLEDLLFAKVVLDNKIFSVNKGELYLGLDKDGICKVAVLKDVVFFGDIRGELIEKNIR